MLKRYLVSLFIAFALQPATVIAHPSGHGPVDETAAFAIAIDAAYQFASFDSGLGFGVLDASWKRLPPESATLAEISADYYIVKVTNPTTLKSLYVLISRQGDIFDANFNGHFPKLK